VSAADGISWARVMDAGLTHVDLLNQGDASSSEWLVTSPSGATLVKIRMSWPGQRWIVWTYVRADRHAGAAVTTREWKLEDSRSYLGDDVAAMLDDVASIVG
jgi:hypothetical protein